MSVVGDVIQLSIETVSENCSKTHLCSSVSPIPVEIAT